MGHSPTATCQTRRSSPSSSASSTSSWPGPGSSCPMRTTGEGRACARPPTFHNPPQDGPRIPRLLGTTHSFTHRSLPPLEWCRDVPTPSANICYLNICYWGMEWQSWCLNLLFFSPRREDPCCLLFSDFRTHSPNRKAALTIISSHRPRRPSSSRSLSPSLWVSGPPSSGFLPAPSAHPPRTLTHSCLLPLPQVRYPAVLLAATCPAPLSL